jgi:chemotaxis protein CheC
MESVEQTFSLRDTRAHLVGRGRVVVFRGRALELHDLASELGCAGGEAGYGVVVWAGGRRRVLAVDELVGQLVLVRLELPGLARGRYCTGVAHLPGGEVVPILEPGAVVGAWELAGDRSFGFDDMQRSALAEIANIGSGHAATALSQLLGKPVDISYAEAFLATLAEAADRIGSAASQSALVDTPIAGDGGKVLLLFPDGAAAQLCELLGTSVDSELGRSALVEVGNILATSYLNAIVELTGLALEPEPPTIEVDVLGTLVEQSLAGAARPDDLTVLLRSCMTVETSDARFAFLFVPQMGSVQAFLDALGVGTAA